MKAAIIGAAAVAIAITIATLFAGKPPANPPSLLGDNLLGEYVFIFEPPQSSEYEDVLTFPAHEGAEYVDITVQSAGGCDAGFCDHPWGGTVIPTARVRPFCEVEVEPVDHGEVYTPAESILEFDGWSEIIDTGEDTCGDGNRFTVDYVLNMTRRVSGNLSAFTDLAGAMLPIRYQQANRGYVSDGSLKVRNTRRDPIVVTVRVYGQPGGVFLPARSVGGPVVVDDRDPFVILDGDI
jgi:hypothetical protein